jgi:hypothetical protein
MEHLQNAVKESLATGNWYAALIVAFTLPDIASNIDHPDQGTNKRFPAWVDTYMIEQHRGGSRRLFMSAKDFYALRCAFLHEGSANIIGKPAREVLDAFQITLAPGHRIHNNKYNNTLQLDLIIICEEILEAIDRWQLSIADDKVKQQRINDLARITFHGYE